MGGPSELSRCLRHNPGLTTLVGDESIKMIYAVADGATSDTSNVSTRIADPNPFSALTGARAVPVAAPGDVAEDRGAESDDTLPPKHVSPDSDTTKASDDEASSVGAIDDHPLAIRARHCILHRPFRPDREACRLAKTTIKMHVRKIRDRKIKKWGELMPCDHVLCFNLVETQGSGG